MEETKKRGEERSGAVAEGKHGRGWGVSEHFVCLDIEFDVCKHRSAHLLANLQVWNADITNMSRVYVQDALCTERVPRLAVLVCYSYATYYRQFSSWPAFHVRGLAHGFLPIAKIGQEERCQNSSHGTNSLADLQATNASNMT